MHATSDIFQVTEYFGKHWVDPIGQLVSMKNCQWKIKVKNRQISHGNQKFSNRIRN